VATQNTFVDTNTAGQATQTGVALSATGATEVSDNSFDSLTQGIVSQGAAGSTPLIARNVFTHIRPASNGLGDAIAVNSGNPTISRNQISTPSLVMAGDSAFGVLANLNGANTTGMTLRANRIDGMSTGVYAGGTGGAVSLTGDLILNSRDAALRLVDDATDDAGIGDATATNVDFAGTGMFGSDVVLSQAQVMINSSILTSVPAVDNGGGGSCSIAFSRGPTTSGNACETFQTSADPQFVNAAAGNYHLAAGSSMIDAGDPSAPDAAAIDLDGEGFGFKPACPLASGTRDIGADEVVPTGCPAPVDPTDPTDPIDQTPPQGDPPDKTAPETTLTKQPKPKLRKRTARFEFMSNEPEVTFICALDDAAPTSCSSPLKLKRLKAGKHRVTVAAVDKAGNVDTTPALAKFKVKPRRR
jgi:hypothetical protein